MSLVQAAVWNVGTSTVDAKGDLQAEGLRKEPSTEAAVGGVAQAGVSAVRFERYADDGAPRRRGREAVMAN
ncbi:MAG TPA: hypothetical protein VKM54_13020 [Myxococcota bacterium]|nr:hypothetical protein [Myxococcota bacterium]